MKSLMDLLYCLLKDSKVFNAHATLDFKTIKRRCKDEGLSFLTISLSSFQRDFESSLREGSMSPGMFLGFRRKKHSSLPSLFSGLMEQIFTSDGVLLDDPSIECIFFIRTICSSCKKILLPCTRERIKGAFDAYIKCEEEVKVDGFDDGNHLYDDFLRTADILWSDALQSVNSDIVSFRHIPRHGPGATAEGISANAKYSIRSWHTRLETYFPVDLFGIPNWNYKDELDTLELLEPGNEEPCRLISVPKTLKTPRIIAIEPVCMQYCQQSLLELIEPALRRSRLLQGCINILDQKPNRRFALSSSRSTSFATLDLKEASDRVSNRLVIDMLRSVPDLRDAIQSCRSRSVKLPDERIVHLKKFASMGSALCFPVQAMVFTTICITTGLRRLNMPINSRNIATLSRYIQVYGDDIIVPTDWALDVTRSLETFGLKVNEHKSFWKGKFRESCGLDAYDGYEVTPVYIRRMPPSDINDVEGHISWVSLRNQLYKAGLWVSARYVETVLGRIYSYPHVSETCPGLGYHSFSNGYTVERYSRDLHSPRVRTLVPNWKPRLSRISSVGALLKFFLKRGSKPLAKGHLDYAGRPVSGKLKNRWVQPF